MFNFILISSMIHYLPLDLLNKNTIDFDENWKKKLLFTLYYYNALYYIKHFFFNFIKISNFVSIWFLIFVSIEAFFI